MDALDNPSYFTLPGTAKSKSSTFSSLLKKKPSSSKSSQRSNSVTSLAQSPRKSKLTRSLSATSDADSHLVSLGNPRPADIDPAMKFVNRRSNSVSHRATPSKFADLDMVHLSGEDDGEVFLSSFSDVKYYNVPVKSRLLGPNKRRHSIGGYLHRDGSSAHSSGGEQKCEGARRRASCSKCHEPPPPPTPITTTSRTGARCGDLMDIAVVSCGHSDTASLWVRYLSSCFQQIAKEQNRPPFKLLNVYVEDILSGLSSIPEQERCAKSRLQVWVLCPKFLARMQDCSDHELDTVMRPGNVLALLLGVSEESISNQHRSTLYNYEHWKRLAVKDQDPTFVGDVLGISMDILSRSWQNQADSEKAHFSIIPKKIKVGQNKLIILMNDPLEPEDHVRVSVDKNGHRIEVLGVKRRNPYTLQFAMPAACLQISILATVFVEKNGESMGHKLVKCESRMRELDQLLKAAENPLHFLCQTLGVSPGDREQLDCVLVAALHKNLPPHFNLLQPHGQRHHSSSEEFPTLLHFAAKFGLEKLSWSLLECPGGEQACQLRNGGHLTPSDIAERSGHHKLADALKGHLQMTELSSMYTYLKGISNQQGFNDSNYLIPRPLHESYIVPPPARPVLSPLTSPTPTSPFYTNLSSYQVPPSPVRVSAPADFPYQNSQTFAIPSYMDNYKIPAGGVARPFSPSASPTEKEHPHLTPFGAYLEMQASHSFGVSSANHLRPSLKLDSHEDRSAHKFSSFGKKHDDINSPCSPHSDSLSHSSSSIKSTSKVEDELIEIINDFKHNVLSISEVEKLVENWRSRNDVQQSFIEKQTQLNEMRKEYDRIQHSLKEHLKRPTPFERIRKFFTRSKSKHASDHGHKGGSDSISAATRPISSLSLHSSSSTSSTGRISTGSGTSLGDSGTHSDHDERKHTEHLKTSHTSNNHHFYSDIPFIPKPHHHHPHPTLPHTPLTHTLSMDEYKHLEKRALCTSCHDYTNLRAPLLRGNSYQENPIIEEDHQPLSGSEAVAPTNEVTEPTNEVATAEVHNTNSETPYNPSHPICNSASSSASHSSCNKETRSCTSSESSDTKCNALPSEESSQLPIVKITTADLNHEEVSTNQVTSVSIELSTDVQEVVSKVCNTFKEDLKQKTEESTRPQTEPSGNINHSDNTDLKSRRLADEKGLHLEVSQKESIQEHSSVLCNGRNRDAFVIETESKINAQYEAEDRNEDDVRDEKISQECASESDMKTVISKVNKVHKLAHMFEHVEDLQKSCKEHEDKITKHHEDINKENGDLNDTSKEQEDLDNSFEKEFRKSCNEIKNIARNSLIKNVGEDFELSKELEPLQQFDSESTLQLSDVDTENCHQYEVTSYVNINTCRTTNL